MDPSVIKSWFGSDEVLLPTCKTNPVLRQVSSPAGWPDGEEPCKTRGSPAYLDGLEQPSSRVSCRHRIVTIWRSALWTALWKRTAPSRRTKRGFTLTQHTWAWPPPPHTHTYHISASEIDTTCLSSPQHHFQLSHWSPICPHSFGSTVRGRLSPLSHIIYHPVHLLCHYLHHYLPPCSLSIPLQGSSLTNARTREGFRIRLLWCPYIIDKVTETQTGRVMCPRPAS